MGISLRFRADATFTIAQFTDLHWQDGDEQDRRTRELMRRVLELERPDLVVFTGDLIESLRCTDPAESIRQAVAVAEERAVPWAAVLGNHDSEKGSRDELGRLLAEGFRYSLFQPGPPELPGVGNYRLLLEGSAGRPAAVLWFLDSGEYVPVWLGRYGWIRGSQIRWYRRESARLAAAHGGPLPALAFFHIPLPEYRRIWRRGSCFGAKFERVNAPWLNTGLFRAMVQQSDVIGTFCGHDHVNDYWGELQGIRLCYGRATGYNTYGREGFQRGARLIRLREGERGFETWLRLEDGTVVHDQPAARKGCLRLLG